MESFSGLLLEQGSLTPADLARAEEIRRRTGGRLAATLARLALAPEADIASALATANGIALVQRHQFPETFAAVDGLNPRFLVRNSVFPLALEDGRLTVAMGDPEDQTTRAALAFASDADILPCVATFSDIQEGLAHGGESLADASDLAGIDLETSSDLERLAESDSEAPVIRLVQRLLAGAVNRRASDVHVEPMARYVAVRYRIDGRLVEVERLPASVGGPIASRIKVMAGLDISETRLPQDGRLRLTVRGREVDVRVSSSPGAWGEGLVLRLLGRSELPLELTRLGLPEAALSALSRALDRPHGIVLVTGPTGSGKTTTLYAALNRLRRPEVKILTVEDPVEVLIEGVTQVQVRPEIELSYGATLRAFLRQDPDILMIGEIRDLETAEIALRAALTGHLVLSTLHTNSAAGAFTRLSDIGIEPYLAASTVIASVAQRLVRSLCRECATARDAFEEEKSLFTATGLVAPQSVFEAVGCAACQGTGYAGRIPLIEVLEVDERLRELIRLGKAEEAEDVRPASDRLAGHGLALVAAGRTSMAEVQRAVLLQ